MTCECSNCAETFDPDQMTQCKECLEYFCPYCWDNHDEVAELMDKEGLDELAVP